MRTDKNIWTEEIADLMWHHHLLTFGNTKNWNSNGNKLAFPKGQGKLFIDETKWLSKILSQKTGKRISPEAVSAQIRIGLCPQNINKSHFKAYIRNVAAAIKAGVLGSERYQSFKQI